MLTGAPFYRVNLQYNSHQGPAPSADEIWSTIGSEFAKNAMLNASTVFSDSGKLTDNGLLNGHAYAILGVFEFSDGLRLMRIRNPWG